MSNIAGTNIAAAVVPFTTADTYPTHYARYGNGGYQVVPDLIALNMITEGRLEVGMLVYCLADGKEYRLTKPVDTWVWAEDAGSDGKSAYELALLGGFVGTEAEWLLFLKGADGVTPEKGVDYDDGSDGKSAFELAVLGGFVGTEAEWLVYLKGADGARYGVSYQTLSSAAAQTIDASISNEALCNVQLVGDTTIMLSNLTMASFGVIDIVEQEEQRVITIIAEDDNQVPVVVKTISGSQMASVIGASISIAWKFNGSWVDINSMEYA
ncbi:MAG: hypothetical protein PF444_00500 [Bacteroidales bacterium]|jgi:hypothetical protein|nr:hypothetical protein [Bacteroidales bacterium]